MTNKKFIPLASPGINDEDISEVVRVLKSGMLVQGPEVNKLEKTIASFIGVKHCIAASNGTATLHLILLALGIGEGDEVIVPAFSYIASANVVELVKATCVFVDIDIKTFNINADDIERVVTSKTRAIIVVHEFGLPADVLMIKNIANKFNIQIIEDAACALGASQLGQMVGSIGLAGSFSLHPRKAISSGEGGLITTDDDELAEKLRVLRNHGISMNNGQMQFIAAGYNYRMTDFQAALVTSQMKRLLDNLLIKKKLAEIYYSELDSSRLRLPFVPKDHDHTWQTFHVLLPESLNQTDVIAQLKSEGIGTNYGAQCIPHQIYYKAKYKLDAEKKFPNAMMAYKKGLALPIYEKLNAEDIQFIAQNVNRLT